MGVWGPGLYQCDTGEDVKAFYIDCLKRNKTSNEIVEHAILNFAEELSDPDDTACFWYALADIQWNYGRLDERVKSEAQKLLSMGAGLCIVSDDDKDYLLSRKLILEKLQNKLNSPQPPPKKITGYKFYRCNWSYGDVFALRLQNMPGEICGDRCLLIEKIDEAIWYPGHVIPVCYIKLGYWDELPASVTEYNQIPYIQISFTRYEDRFLPIDGSRPEADIEEKSKRVYTVDEYGYLPQYRVQMITTSSKVIPKTLKYIGNFQGAKSPSKEFVPHSDTNVTAFFWKELEARALNCYIKHNLRKSKIYLPKV